MMNHQSQKITTRFSPRIQPGNGKETRNEEAREKGCIPPRAAVVCVYTPRVLECEVPSMCIRC